MLDSRDESLMGFVQQSLDNDRNTQPVAVVQDAVEECGFTGSEKAGQDGDWKFWGHLNVSLSGFGGLVGA